MEAERTAILETRVDIIDDKIAGIGGMEKAIESLGVKLENTNEKIMDLQLDNKEQFNRVNDNLEKLIVLNTELQTIKDHIAQIENDFKSLNKKNAANEERLKNLENTHEAEETYRRERMKSRYALWGSIGVALISLIASICSLALH